MRFPQTQRFFFHTMHIANRRCVVWDEANIELCEAGKDAQMKIDEPKTPYNFLLMSRSESEDEGDDEDAHCEAETKVPPPQSLEEALKRLTSEGEAGAADSDETMTEEERQRKHTEFEEHRRKHYNEFLAVKRFREEKLRKLQSEGHDNDEDDDADEADEEK